eukprot:899593-Pleurochrysis_carterae.AAC.1
MTFSKCGTSMCALPLCSSVAHATALVYIPFGCTHAKVVQKHELQSFRTPARRTTQTTTHTYMHKQTHASVERKDSVGGTSKRRVLEQAKKLQARLRQGREGGAAPSRSLKALTARFPLLCHLCPHPLLSLLAQSLTYALAQIPLLSLVSCVLSVLRSSTALLGPLSHSLFASRSHSSCSFPSGTSTSIFRSLHRLGLSCPPFMLVRAPKVKFSV